MRLKYKTLKSILGPFFEVHTDDVIRNVKKITQSQKQIWARSWMSAQHHLFGVPTEGKFLVLLYYAKVGLDRRHFDN